MVQHVGSFRYVSIRVRQRCAASAALGLMAGGGAAACEMQQHRWSGLSDGQSQAQMWQELRAPAPNGADGC